MTEFASVSQVDLKERRKQLRRLRQMKIIQSIWRTLAVSSFAGGLLWVAVQPIWVLEAPKQIKISGNKFFSQERIRSQLMLSYPQSLWRIQPGRIEKSLLKQPFIAQAVVTRSLFPPKLIVQIQERKPVAITNSDPLGVIPYGGGLATSTSINSKVNSNKHKNQKQQQASSVALIDADGVLIAVDKYTSLHPQAELPSLKVHGYTPKLRSQWIQIYQVLSQTSLKVMEINFQDSKNLILKTELGIVHFGVPSSLFPKQIEVLLQMRQLPKKLNSTEIDYIDIKNPEQPLVQMNHKKDKIKN
ncbi:MAG: FtsQ-type POTRA domain-containing protein, partial [Cyanobacteria bacterium P01_A01_bin.84]